MAGCGGARWSVIVRAASDSGSEGARGGLGSRSDVFQVDRARVPTRWPGSCLSAARVTSMWSMPVSEPALPGRNWTRERLPGACGAVVGEGPERVDPLPRLNVGPVCPYLSGRSPRSRQDQSQRRTGLDAAGAVIVRDTIGSEASDPNPRGSARNNAMSARQSPPNANGTARSRTTLPGS